MATLLETERLVRKISELLQPGGSTDVSPKLAEDFAAVCHATNLRLQQCEAMIKAGDRHQAIQLAETAPNLLDVVTVLEFSGADEWRAQCQQNSLPAAERIDARSVHVLNECYSQGIATDHPLYAIYRRAVLSRDDDEALKALQSITRLNPGDGNATSELARLDAKVLSAKMQHLGSSLEGADTLLLVSEIEAIEAFGFKTKPNGEVWRNAQTIRCGRLLEEATGFKSTSDWVAALGKMELIHQLQAELKLDFSSAFSERLKVLEAWARGEQEKDKKEREFRSLLGELHHRIHQSEEKDTSARYIKLPELRDDYEALHKVWRSLTDFTRPIPEDATSSFRKRSALLESEIARRTTIHRRIIVGSSVLVLVVGGVIAWFTLGQMKIRDFSRQLRAAIAQRQVHAADALLERARKENIGDANAIADAQGFATKEHTLLASFEKTFSMLPQQFSGEPDAPRLSSIADQLGFVRKAFNALAPELKTENEPRLQTFENQWQKYLSENTVAVNSLLGQWVAAAEKESRELDYRSPMEKTAAQMATLSGLMQKIGDCEVGFSNRLSLRSDLLLRSATVRAKFAAYDRELKKIENGMTAIRSAHTMKDFSDGIILTASSEFSASPAASAASLVQSLNVNAETTIRLLLGATNASTWAYIGKTKGARFVPEVVMPAERQILQQLNDDPAISPSHQLCRLWLDQEGTKSVDWMTVGAFDTSEGWKQIKAWSPSKTATSAVFEDRQYGYFDGQCKLSPTQPVYRIDQLGTPQETTSFNSVGLEKVWSGSDAYGKPLLEVLDSIKDSKEGSPLFRAFLFLHLAAMMRLQPDAWGLTFSPAVQAHTLQIRSIVGEQFVSGDWFVMGKVSACSGRLEELFASSKLVSYAKQAGGLLTLARAVSTSGLQYVGFIGLDGKPNYIDKSSSGEVWGYSPASKNPVLLAARIEPNKPLNFQGMPLSPLFALEKPCKDYLVQANVDPSDGSFQGTLPPLFQKPAQ